MDWVSSCMVLYQYILSCFIQVGRLLQEGCPVNSSLIHKLDRAFILKQTDSNFSCICHEYLSIRLLLLLAGCELTAHELMDAYFDIRQRRHSQNVSINNVRTLKDETGLCIWRQIAMNRGNSNVFYLVQKLQLPVLLQSLLVVGILDPSKEIPRNHILINALKRMGKRCNLCLMDDSYYFNDV